MHINLKEFPTVDIDLDDVGLESLDNSIAICKTCHATEYLNSLMSEVTGEHNPNIGLESLDDNLRLDVGLEARAVLTDKYLKSLKDNIISNLEILRIGTANVAGEVARLKVILEPLAAKIRDHCSIKDIPQKNLDALKEIFIPYARAKDVDVEDVIYKSPTMGISPVVQLGTHNIVNNLKATVDSRYKDIEESKALLNRVMNNNLIKSKPMMTKLKQIMLEYKEGDILLAYLSPSKDLFVRHIYVGFNDVIDNVVKLSVGTGVKHIKLSMGMGDVDKAICKAYDNLIDKLDSEFNITYFIDRVDTVINSLTVDTDYGVAVSMVNHTITNLNIQFKLVQDELKLIKMYNKIIQNLIY